ncbi:hypothetical protein AOQ84DRAFT_370884 [Glonium stellatum]|uniref:F-box domain-containing protein n=1 Tax=Glonium stellatum TaxID=574774 RepID=A0A8E2JYX1_9PEZI|nr:hypothetical protein AOQ84DRAFT_370884 [Glonium stellatum]
MPIVDLPNELMGEICGLLDTDAMFSLRLSCKELKRKTLYQFGTRFFRSMRFMIFPDSLKALLDISQSEELACFLRQVYIGTDELSSETLLLPKSCYDTYLDILAEQIDMEKKGEDIAMLGTALSNLPNLDGVTITDEVASPLLGRPSENQESWGKCLVMKRLRKTVGPRAFINNIFQQDSSMHTYGLFHKALEMHKLRRVELRVHCSASLWRRTAPTIDEDNSLWPDPTHLGKVELLIPEGDTWLSPTNALLFKPTHLRRLELMHLRLGCVTQCFIKIANSYFPSLRVLELRYCTVGTVELQRLLTKHSAILEQIKMKSCELEQLDWRPIFVTMQQMPKLGFLKLKKLHVRQATRELSHCSGCFHVEWRSSEIAAGLATTISNYAAVTAETDGGIFVLFPE